MYFSPTQRSFLLAAAASMTLFLAKATFIATSSLQGLSLTHWIIDDAFIIMRVARNIALGHGFTYDYVHATTGSPPLWTYVTSINHSLFSLEWAVKSTIIEMSLFGALSTLLVFLIARKVSGKESAGWIALTLASFTGNAFFQGMNGMETAMFTFAVLLSVSLWLGIGKPKSCTPRHWKLLTGISLGLCSMIRGDAIFLVGAIVAMEMWTCVSCDKSDRKHALQDLASVLLGWGVLFGALIVWQMLRTGSPLLGNQVGRREIALALHNFSYDQFALLPYLRIVIWNVFELVTLLSIALGSWVILLFAWEPAREKNPELDRLSGLTALYIASFLGTLALYQWYFPDLHGLRYINPMAHLAFVLLGVRLARMSMVLHRMWQWSIVAALIIVSQYSFYDLCMHFPWTKDMSYIARPTKAQIEKGWAPIDWAKKNIPTGSVVAVRDHGRFALFTDLPVQDIAGTIDPSSPKHIKEGSLREYLLSRNVRFAVIPPLSVRSDLVYQAMFKELQLQEIAGAPTYGLAKFYSVKQ